MFRVIMRRMCSVPQCTKPPMSVYGLEGNYVIALYSAALKKQQLEEVEKHMKVLLEELKKGKMLEFLENKFITTPMKARILKEVAEQVGMPDTASNFLKVVAENGRLKNLKRILKMFLDVMMAHRHEAVCEVTTAEPLDDNTRKKLIEAIQKHVKSGRKIQLVEKVDEEIIGGMIIGIEDSLIDMSILGKTIMYANILRQPLGL